MILKGSQRSGGQGLAVHLLNMTDNEHVRVHELRGFTADDLKGAFKEVEAISRGTKCRQYLFSLSLSPPEQARATEDDFARAIERIEERLELQGQPRAVIFHEKDGRQHAHCVWSRIDVQTMTARPLPYFKTKLQAIGRDLYLEHGWKMPRGFDNAAERNPTNFTLAEWQQAKRQGVEAQRLRATAGTGSRCHCFPGKAARCRPVCFASPQRQSRRVARDASTRQCPCRSARADSHRAPVRRAPADRYGGTSSVAHSVPIGRTACCIRRAVPATRAAQPCRL